MSFVRARMPAVDDHIIWDMAAQPRRAAAAHQLIPFTVADAGAAAAALESALTAAGHRIHPASWLGRAVANATVGLPTLIREDARPPGTPCPRLGEHVERHQLAADLMMIWRTLSHVAGGLTNPVLAPRLRDLCSGDQTATASAQRSQARDLTFELVCLGWISRFAADVRLDEPDILCVHEGAVWGVACKVAYGDPATTARAIKKGAAQLQRSAAQFGVVAVRITDVFPHEKLPTRPTPERRTVGAFLNPDDVQAALWALAQPYIYDVMDGLDTGGVPALARRCPKLRAVVFVGHTLVLIRRPDGSATALAPIHACFSGTDTPPSFAVRMWEALRW